MSRCTLMDYLDEHEMEMVEIDWFALGGSGFELDVNVFVSEARVRPDALTRKDRSASGSYRDHHVILSRRHQKWMLVQNKIPMEHRRERFKHWLLIARLRGNYSIRRGHLAEDWLYKQVEQGFPVLVARRQRAFDEFGGAPEIETQPILPARTLDALRLCRNDVVDDNIKAPTWVDEEPVVEPAADEASHLTLAQQRRLF